MATPLLQIDGVSKSFSGVKVLDNVSLTLMSGEILALLGENGAGKSTLMNILSGALAADCGRIRIKGKTAVINSVKAAASHHVAMIHQEFNLLYNLTVGENIMLGREPSRMGFIRSGKERRQCLDALQRVGLAVSPETPCASLSIAQQQLLEIARVLDMEAEILIMDEPTAALSGEETATLFRLVRELKAKNLGIIFISHHLDEIYELTDRMEVLRDGANAGGGLTADLPRRSLIEMMVGRNQDQEFPPRPDKRISDEPVLKVEGLCRKGAVQDISFELHAGEILGLAGLAGAGRTETVRLLFGADHKDGGVVTRNGRIVTVDSPQEAIGAGIGLLPESRKTQSIVPEMSAQFNFALADSATFGKWGFLRGEIERRRWNHYREALQVRGTENDKPIRSLSGGNQQKVILARWLQTDVPVLLLDEPTRGVDVGAKYEIYQIILQLAASGKAIILISSELPEILALSDRVLVMREGRISGELSGKNIVQQSIMQLAMN